MATEQWKDRRIQELENEVVELKAQNDKLRQDNADLLPEADAVGWALNEMNMALSRAKAAEIRVVQLERELKGVKTRPPVGRPTEAENMPVDPGPVVSSFSPPPQPRLTRVESPHAAMEDLLGFPKEGR